MQRKATNLPYTEFPVAFGDFDTNRNPIDMIVLHTEVGFKTGTEATFDNPQSHVSAHYGVSQDGTIDHFLEEYNTAYHAGDYSINLRSIGIEHEDFDKPNDPRTDALYDTSSKLVADICKFYGIPCNRQHIKKHTEVLPATQCPDSLDVDRIVNAAYLILNPPVPEPVIDENSIIDLSVLDNKTALNEVYGKLKVQEIEAKFTAKDLAISNLQKNVDSINKQLTECQNKPPEVITTKIVYKNVMFPTMPLLLTKWLGKFYPAVVSDDAGNTNSASSQ